MPDVYYDSTLTGKELDDALRGIPANVTRAETAEANAAASAKAAESWAQGGTETREGEDEDNAEYWAGQAKSSSESAAADSKVVKDNLADIQAIGENLTAIQNAPNAAERAEAAAESAQGDADRAELAADRAQSIGQGALGYFPTAAELKTAHETGENGQWAIIGETDTIWVWDSDTTAWTDSGQKTDLSKYYTKDETDQQINELQETLAPQITKAQQTADAAFPKTGGMLMGDIDLQGTYKIFHSPNPEGPLWVANKQYVDDNAMSRTWTLTLPQLSWAGSAGTGFSQTVSAPGMTSAVQLAGYLLPVFDGVETLEQKKALQTAVGYISELSSEDGTVTVTCYDKQPEQDFSVIVTEVK